VEALQAVLPFTDAVLFDIKLIDPELHKKYTGQANEIILGNLALIVETIRKVNQARAQGEDRKMTLWIRTPLIPDTTATEENITAIGAFLHSNFSDVVERWELCAFNPACKSKYKKMDLTWAYAETPLMGQTEIDRIKTCALAGGFPSDKLVISGLIAKESSQNL
jgi:pyruvate formate lyase activating enzyme